MGQQRYTAIVYGAILNTDQFVAIQGDDSNGILDQWETVVRAKIQATVTAKNGFWGAAQADMEQEYKPQMAYESEDAWIGFIVAITDDNLADWWGKAGVIRNQACALADIATLFPAERKRAEKRWNRFAKFCAKNGTELTGQLLFVADFD